MVNLSYSQTRTWQKVRSSYMNTSLLCDFLQVAEWTKEISGYWRALSPAERAPFEKMAATDKARYDQQVIAFTLILPCVFQIRCPLTLG